MKILCIGTGPVGPCHMHNSGETLFTRTRLERDGPILAASHRFIWYKHMSRQITRQNHHHHPMTTRHDTPRASHPSSSCPPPRIFSTLLFALHLTLSPLCVCSSVETLSFVVERNQGCAVPLQGSTSAVVTCVVDDLVTRIGEGTPSCSPNVTLSSRYP